MIGRPALYMHYWNGPNTTWVVVASLPRRELLPSDEVRQVERLSVEGVGEEGEAPDVVLRGEVPHQRRRGVLRVAVVEVEHLGAVAHPAM